MSTGNFNFLIFLLEEITRLFNNNLSIEIPAGDILKYISDFHIHSHYSMATSKKLVPEYLEYWARIKGINVIGTGDCVHPGWFKELREKLEPCDNGFFRLKNEYRLRESRELSHENIPDKVYFMLTGELSSIYKKNDRVRKVHNLCVFPDFDSLQKVQGKLDSMGNIRSDGRPILGIDSRDILEMTLDSSDYSFLIPAHIWTPWFSVLGSKSGFDTIDECYEDLTDNIFALETGLSSDPPMNWSCSFLDRFRLVSNSDAHSPEKLGREANLFDCELSYRAMYEALKYDRGFTGTIEFFPEEGKYHLDGHRKCGIVWTPEETLRHDGICPVCGKPVTKGVMYRVSELSDREDARTFSNKKEFHSITQLPDLISEIMNIKSSSSKRVQEEYFRIIKNAGSEFFIYLDSDLEDVKRVSGEVYAEGIERIRKGDVIIKSGYDGEFGRVKVFKGLESAGSGTASLFPSEEVDEMKKVMEEAEAHAAGVPRSKKERGVHSEIMKTLFKRVKTSDSEEPAEVKLNDKQKLAVQSDGPICVMAGPGSGKTRVLVERILYTDYTTEGKANIAAVTFSNRAAREMGNRLKNHTIKSSAQVCTFHSLGLKILEENISIFGRDDDFKIAESDELTKLIKKSGIIEPKSIKKALREITYFKQGISDLCPDFFENYENLLHENNLVDVDDLIFLPVKLLSQKGAVYDKWHGRFTHILVDEFQDINAIQYSFLNLLYGVNTDLFVIGDVNQAIYGFRGADVSFMINLKEDYSDLKEISLNTSYRCPGTVLSAASAVVGTHYCIEGTRAGIPIDVRRFKSQGEEAEFIASEINNILGGVNSYSMEVSSNIRENELSPGDIAVLCRTSLLFESLSEAFERHGIPFQISGSKTGIYRDNLKSALHEAGDVLAGRNRSRDLSNIMEEACDNIPETMMNIMEYLDLEYDENYLRLSLDPYGSIDEAVRYIALEKDGDDFIPELDAVTLMTMHASKGLEFDTVFIPAFEEGVVPFTMYGDDALDLDEERRIAYVAMTRTKEKLCITSSQNRNLKKRKMKNRESSFLAEIPCEYLDKHSSSRKDDDRQLNLF